MNKTVPEKQKSAPLWKNVLSSMISSFAGALLGYSVYLGCLYVGEISTILYKVFTEQKIDYNCVLVIVPFVILTLGIEEIYRKKYIALNKGEKPGFEFQSAILPSSLLLPFFFMEISFFTPLLFMAVWGLCIFRLAAIWPGNLLPKWRYGNAANLSLVIAGIILAVIYGTLLQQKMLSGLYLDYWDWGAALNVIDNTLKGKWFYSNGLERNTLGDHLQPGAFLFLAPYVYLFRSATAFFIINPLLLNISALMLYLLAVRKGISKGEALVFAFAFMLCPSISNMCPSIFYGFHVEYLAMPCIALFFLCYEIKYFRTAFLIFLFSLTVKETVAVFWTGLGAVFILSGKRKSGVLIFAVSLAYYMIASKLIMPAIHEQCGMLSRYGHLGNTYTEILFSPFTKPDVFFESVFRHQNVYLLIMLLLPVMAAVCNYPLLLLAGGIIYLFMSMQLSAENVTNFVQHQAEIVVLFYICAIYGYAKLREKQARFYSLALAGLKKSFSPDAIRQAVLLATVCSSLSAFYFFSVGCFGGKNSHLFFCFMMPDMSEEVGKLKTFIPPGKGVSATTHLAAHLILRNDVFMCRGENPQEYILMDLCDALTNNNDFETFRRRALLSEKYNMVYHTMEKGHSWLVLKCEAKKPFPEIFSRMKDEKWNSFGMPLDLGNPDFSGRIIYERGQKFILIYVRVERKVDYDVFVRVNFLAGNRDKMKGILRFFPFGYGFRPAYTAEKGDVFALSVPVETDNLSCFFVRLEKRAAPDAAPGPF